MKTFTAKDTEPVITSIAGMNRAVLEAIHAYLELPEVKGDPSTLQLFKEIELTLNRHSVGLGALAAVRDIQTTEELKAAFGGILGSLAGLYSQLRTQPAERAVRDTYTALSHLNICYLSLKTQGLTLGDERTSKTAYAHFSELTDLIVKLADQMVAVTHRITAHQHETAYDVAVIERVNKAAHRAWRS